MYLNMIEKDGDKKVFMQLANIVAISCQEAEEKVEEQDTFRSFLFGGAFGKDLQIVDVEGWKPSEKEEALLKQYWNELDGSNSGNSSHVGLLIGTHKIDEAITELQSVLKQVKSMDDTSRRKAIVDKLVDDCVNWEDVSEMPQKIGKIMILELLGLAMVDHDYAELERYTIGLIATKFDIEMDDLEEMEEFILSYMSKFVEGLEIINA